MPTTNFLEQTIGDLIDREGGFVDHPADKGGATRWGVTEKVARANGYTGSMRDLPRELAIKIYRAKYWQAPAFDRVAAIAPTIAGLLFDIGVNMGPGVAAGFLQRALNSLNRGARDYPDIPVDQSIGRRSLDALARFLAVRGASEGEPILYEAIDSLRGYRFIELSEQRPANEAFTVGWFGRMVAMVKARFK